MEINFANLQWSINRDESIIKLKDQGFRCEKSGNDTLYADGSLLSLKCNVYCIYDDIGLSEAAVHMDVKDDYWETFDRVKNLLMKKYNDPSYEGDNYFWWMDVEGNSVGLLQDDDYEKVYINYQSSRRASELKAASMQEIEDEDTQAEDLL